MTQNLSTEGLLRPFRRHRTLPIGLGFFLLAAVAILDYLTGKELSLSIFYLLPISLVTWFSDGETGFVFAVLSATLEFYSNFKAGLAYASRYNPYWNVLAQLAFYCTFVLILTLLKREYVKKTGLVKGLQKALSELGAAEKDLTEKKEALAKSNRELEQFAYVAAHDLKSPLIAVEGNLMRLARKCGEKLDPEGLRITEHALDSVTRMGQLISDLLAYARLGAEVSVFTPTDCNIVFERAISNLQVDIADAGALVSRDELPTVMANDTLLTELLQNLISNGIKFCHEKRPQIHVSAGPQDGEWVFSVSDNGPGIDTEDADRIFGMFQRLHNQSHCKGTGIGLAVCRKIVEIHGGQIWLKSVVGSGSTFFFTIPEGGRKRPGNLDASLRESRCDRTSRDDRKR